MNRGWSSLGREAQRAQCGMEVPEGGTWGRMDMDMDMDMDMEEDAALRTETVRSRQPRNSHEDRTVCPAAVRARES